MARENLETQALAQFVEAARAHGYIEGETLFMGQGRDNRILLEQGAYFQFGDLRVETPVYHLLIETESAGGLTNLLKFWYLLEEHSRVFTKPVVLFHLFRQSSPNDYGAHLVLWDFVWQKMEQALGSRMRAFCYGYRTLEDLGPIVRHFEEYLKP